MIIRNTKLLSLALAGVVVAATAASPMSARAVSQNNVRAPKVNVTNFIFNSTGRVVIKDLLRVTKNATFRKNVSILQGLTVGGDVNIANLKFAGTADVSEMDTDDLVGGEVYYDEDDNKLYLWNTTEWVDLSAEAGDSSFGDSIESSEIEDDTIVAADIATQAVGASELATDSVNSGKVENDTLAAVDLAADSVGSSEIAADAVGASELADDAVVAANIDDATITNAKMVNDTLDFDKIDDTPTLDAATVLALGANNLDINLDSTGEFAVQDGGADVLHVADDTGVTTVSDDLDLSMGAAENMAIDSATTDSTTTAGVLDMDVDAGNAAVDGLNIDMEQADGAAAATDATAAEVLLTASDADGDMFGLTITSAATANAASGSYEAGIKVSNAENTAGAMTDALLVTTTSGTSGDIVDAVDASAADITNALNIGANTITGTTGIIDLTDFDVDADGLVTLAPDGGGTGITLTPSATLTKGLDFNSNNVTTDIELQNDETIDNNTDGTVAITATTTALSGAVTAGGNATITGNVSPEAAGTRNLGGTSAEWAALYLDDDTGLNLGLDQDALLTYDETTDDRVELTGSGASLYLEDRLGFGRQDLDVADNGGGTAATQTLTPTTSFVALSCADGDGCTITMDEAAAKDGDVVTIVSDQGSSSFADTSGLSELTGAITLGQWDTLQLMYVSDRWVELATSNN